MAENPYAAPQAEVVTPFGDAPALWNPNAAGNWSLLFTPVFGSYLVWKNWQAMGERSRGRAWLIVSILMLVPSALLPGVGFIYLIVWYFSSARSQARLVQERWAKDYPRRGWGKPLLVGFAAWGLLVGSFFVIGLFAV